MNGGTAKVLVGRRWVVIMATLAAIACVDGVSGEDSSESIAARRRLAEAKQKALGFPCETDTPPQDLVEDFGQGKCKVAWAGMPGRRPVGYVGNIHSGRGLPLLGVAGLSRHGKCGGERVSVL